MKPAGSWSPSRIGRRYAAYDLAAVRERLERDGVPARDYVLRYFKEGT